ncbi:MAG TPA: valine--tRNA ligase, partial [Nitrospirae bacterium]|nr:valine--tRNA ligase [Nitrospirota bacterium]
NVVDPLKMSGAYGTDALRFTLAAYAAQGRDIKFDEKRVEGYRHFLNKIWNVARFISINIKEGEEIISVRELCNNDSQITLSLADRWILSRLSTVCSEVNKSLEDYRFNDTASILYQFIWHELCDWYVEMIKPELYGENEESKRAAISTLVHVFEAALALIHPFMPFISEEIWQQLPMKKKVDSLCIRKYPTLEDGIENKEAEEKMSVIMDAVTAIRSIRGELNIPPSLELRASIRTLDSAEAILNTNITYVKKLAKAKDIEIGNDVQSPGNAATAIKPDMEIFVPLKGLIDIDAEINRLNKELARTEKELMFVKKKLANEDFISKAPGTVVEENKARHNDYVEKLQGIRNSIEKLEQWGKQEE